MGVGSMCGGGMGMGEMSFFVNFFFLKKVFTFPRQFLEKSTMEDFFSPLPFQPKLSMLHTPTLSVVS